MRALRFHAGARSPDRGRGRTAGAECRRRGRSGRHLRYLRNRPARVRRGADRHPGRAAPAHGSPEPADPRPRILGRGRCGRRRASARWPRATALRSCRSPTAALRLLPARAAASLRDHGLRRALPCVGRDGRARNGRGVPGRSASRTAVTYAQGALIEPTAVAAYGVERAGVGPGDRVLVTGAGPIGALAALCARSAGASTVYISEPNPARRARAEALGVATVLDPTSRRRPAHLRDRERRPRRGCRDRMLRASERLLVRDPFAPSARHAGTDRALRRRGSCRADALGAERPDDRRNLVLLGVRLRSNCGPDRSRRPARRASRHARQSRSMTRRMSLRSSRRAKPTRSRC